LKKSSRPHILSAGQGQTGRKTFDFPNDDEGSQRMSFKSGDTTAAATSNMPAPTAEEAEEV